MSRLAQFIYCESQPGGMQHEIVNWLELEKFCWKLNGWMTKQCEESDSKLVDFLQKSHVGQMHEWRMGVWVRLQDTEG